MAKTFKNQLINNNDNRIWYIHIRDYTIQLWIYEYPYMNMDELQLYIISL